MKNNGFTLAEVGGVPSPRGRARVGADCASSVQRISPSLEFVSSHSFANKFFSLPRRDRRAACTLPEVKGIFPLPLRERFQLEKLTFPSPTAFFSRRGSDCRRGTSRTSTGEVRVRGKKAAFTLAEVLITLGIIGVVAAITMPMLITNINERINSERQANIAQKITQAMEQMRAHGLLNQSYASTDAFVDELQKYLKISKRCSASNIADCWPTTKVTGNDNETYIVSETTTRDKLHMGENNGNNNVGLVLADGASLILTYNTDAGALDVGDSVTASKIDLPVGGGKTKEFPYTTSVTGAIDFVMDVNGAKGPNMETTADKVGDIRAFKAAKFGKDCPSVTLNGKIKGMCVVNLGTSYTCNTNNNRCWGGAKKACSDIGMSLASRGDLNTIYAQKGKVKGVPTSGWFWSSAEYDYGNAWNKSFDFGDSHCSKDFKHGALCVGN